MYSRSTAALLLSSGAMSVATNMLRRSTEGRPFHLITKKKKQSRQPFAFQSSVFDRQFLQAREQDAIDPLLAPEVLLAVLEQPSRQRQQHLALREQNQCARRR